MRRWLTILALALGLGHPEGSLAQEPSPAPVMPATVGPRIEVEVMIIHAAKGAPAIDPRLAGMMDQLSALPFDSYKLLDQHAVRLIDGSKDAVQLAGDRALRVYLISHDAREARVRVELMSGEQQVMDTTVSIHRNRAFYLAVRGYEGGSLIVPVSVRY